MKAAAQEIKAKLEASLQHVDESAVVLLKGHLIIEEALNEIIGTFVFHSEQLDKVRISFAQKVAIARAMSLDEHENEMWQLILAVNSLRNELAHSLNSPKRQKKTKALIDLQKKLRGQTTAPDGSEVPEHVILSFVVAFSLGFLSGFIEEVRRFRAWLDEMEKIINPHRHK